MATCTIAGLNVACFRGQTLDPHQRKALMVFFMASELKGIGGTDYTALLISPASGGLLGDTKALFDEKSSLDDVGARNIGTFELAIAQASAIAVGGTAAASIQDRMQSIKCLQNVNESLLDRMILFLTCQLGVHKSYPQ